MKLIRCESCHKSYDFDRSEVCPECGAFNNADGGHANHGSLEAAYRQEKRAQERSQRQYEQKLAQEQSDINDAERDAAKWMEMEQRASSFQGEASSQTKPKRSNKTLVISIIIFIAVGYAILFFVGFFGMLFGNISTSEDSISISEWEEDGYTDTFVEEDPKETFIYGNEDITIGNIQVNIGDPILLKSTGNQQLDEGYQVWIVPYTGFVESALENQEMQIVNSALLGAANGEPQEYWEELDFAVWDMAEEQTGYICQPIDDLFYMNAGENQEAAMTFILPKGSVPVGLKLEVVQLHLAEGADSEQEIDWDILQEITVEF